MKPKCNYPGECANESMLHDCNKTNMACQHQSKLVNSKRLRVGPDQDGRWYSVQNDDFKAEEQPLTQEDS